MPADAEPLEARLHALRDASRYQVAIGGGLDEVRVLGVLVLPLDEPSRGGRCSGSAALLAVRDLVDDRLRLVPDRSGPDRDARGALLRYVQNPSGTVDVGAALVERGLAVVDRRSDFLRRGIYLQLEEEARHRREGLWPACADRLDQLSRGSLGGDRRPKREVEFWSSSPLPTPPPSPPPRLCCRTCTKGKPCGDSCIRRDYTCRKPPGCAC